MTKKILILGIMVIMALGLFTGCGGNKGISFNIGDVGGFSTEALDGYPVIAKLIKSEGELQQLCDESGIIYSGEKYDGSYFEEKAIIVLFFISESISIQRHQIDGVKLDGSSLMVTLTRIVPRGGMLDAIGAGGGFVIEIKQDDIKDATSIQVINKYKNK